jgi:hypothetical protein
MSEKIAGLDINKGENTEGFSKTQTLDNRTDNQAFFYPNN